MYVATIFVSLGVYITLVQARGSTYYVNSRYSDNVLQDANLDVPDLIQKYGYPIEVHNVTTDDGYILEMHRIPYGRDNNSDPDVTRPVVFLMHGLYLSSADWVIMGPGSGFGYILAEEGFDVWMGNARGNDYSRKHVTLNPDSLLDKTFWDFSWDEIGNIDLPAMIDYVLELTGQEKLHFVGHSQGNTVFFVMASLRPAYNDKIISMHAFAPVAFMDHAQNLLLLFLAPFANDLGAIVTLLGTGEFLPNTEILRWAGEELCRDEVVTQALCSNILYLIGGWNEQQQNTTMLPVIFTHAPAGSSIRQTVHYAQCYNSKLFRRYDHGTLLDNWEAYGSFTPPQYDLSNVTAPVYLHYANIDLLSSVVDVTRLYEGLGNAVGMFQTAMGLFSHVDYIYGIDAKELLYDPTIELIRAVDTSEL